MLALSFAIVSRVSGRALRRRVGGSFGSLLQVAFSLGLLGQVAGTIYQQTLRLGAMARDDAAAAAAQVALVFVLDTLGVALLLPAAMIRADGIAGKQRAAVDTELWLTLPLDGPRRVLARLGQASFFLSLLGFFLLSHFLGPALVFGRSAAATAALFVLLGGAALALLLGLGVIGYVAARRYLPPHRQGQLVAWAGLALLPLGYAYALVVRGGGGALARVLSAVVAESPMARLLRAALRGDLFAAAQQAGLLCLFAGALLWLCWELTRRLSREAVDDLAPLTRSRRYPAPPGPPRALSLLAKDLRLSLRDPSHRGVFLSAWLLVFLPQIVVLVYGSELTVLLRQRVGEQGALGVACFFLGLSVLLSASLWLPLEARAVPFLLASGVTPRWLLRRKAMAASLQALLLSVPLCSFLLRYLTLSRWLVPLLIPYALFLAWFMVGETAARILESRRDTRPVQLRSIYAGYLLVLLASVALPLSGAYATLTLCGLLLIARLRLRTGARVLAAGEEVA